MTLDIDKLAKIMEYTFSEHDGEVLAAIRRAQRMMAEHKLTWTELLKPGSTQRNGFKANSSYSPSGNGHTHHSYNYAGRGWGGGGGSGASDQAEAAARCARAAYEQQQRAKQHMDSAKDMLDELESIDDVSPNTEIFLDSLRSFFNDRGYLTEKQMSALKKIYDEHF